MKDYAYRSTCALVALHKQHKRSFLATWQKATRTGIVLLRSTDPAYKSMEMLLRHPLKSSHGYKG